MSIKIFLLFVILHFATIYSVPTPPELDNQQKTLEEIFDSIQVHDDDLWKKIPPEQNIQISPLSAQVCANTAQMAIFYVGGLINFYPKDVLFGPVYAFANTTDTLQKSSNVKLKLSNAVFYKENNITQKFLDDLVTYQHSELYKTSFEPQDNATVLVSINEWISKKTNGRGQKLDQLATIGSNLVQISTSSFTGCWNKPKNPVNTIKTFKFKTPKEEITIEAIHATENIGYYNNSESKYEVIRLPYKNGEFAMAIVLPYQDQQLLDVFKNPSDTQKYHQIFDQINAHEEPIEYTIPIMNSNSISINEKGTEVNGDNPIVCDTSATPEQHITSQTNNKQFNVNRPFAVFIYDVKTKYVVVHALVKNPTSKYSSLNILGSGNQRREPDIRVSSLYEFFQIHQ